MHSLILPKNFYARNWNGFHICMIPLVCIFNCISYKVYNNIVIKLNMYRIANNVTFELYVS